MTEQLINGFIPHRVKQLGYNNYHLQFRDMVIKGNSKMILSAYNELYFIIDDPHGLQVESDYGVYDPVSGDVFDNIHQHKGEIIITNSEAANKRIKFIRVILIN